MRWVCTIADGEFYNGVGDVARASLVLQRQGEDGQLVFKRAGKQGDSPLTSLHPSAEITIGCPHDPINQEALEALTPDDTNVIAIECVNKGGGQYIDFGLSGIRPLPTGIKKPIATEASLNGIYNLSAQRLSAPRTGINIINGKKILY